MVILRVEGHAFILVCELHRMTHPRLTKYGVQGKAD